MPRRPSWRLERRRRAVRRVLLGLGVVLALLAVVGALAAYRLVGAARDLQAARGLIDGASSSIDGGDLAGARSQLAQAAGRLTGAQSKLSRGRAELDVVRALPVAGDNLVELRRSIGIALELANGGVRILDAGQRFQGADGRLEVGLDRGTVPLAAINAVLGEVDLLRTSLPDLADLDDDPGTLLGPVRELRTAIDDEVVRRTEQLGVLSDVLGLLAELSGGTGDRNLLIAVANTAEMRGAGGMVLNFGGLVGRGGTFTLPLFSRIDDLFLLEPIDRASVPEVPDDYLARWDGFEPLRLWRNATLAGDFTIVAPVLERMAEVYAPTPIDGVIQVDPQGLAAMLRAVGPVDVPEVGRVDADNLVDVVLYQAYVQYPGIQSRSDVLEEVARAAFTRLVTGTFPSLRTLGSALLEAVEGRHLQVHTTSPAAEERLRRLGADGSLPDPTGPDAFHLTLQNVSANKLDYFVDTAVDLRGDRRPGRPSRVSAEVVVRNSAPEGQTTPKYVFGPFDRSQVAGLYRGVVTLYLPAGTNLVEVGGDAGRYPVSTGTEGGRPYVSYTVDLAAGQRHAVTLELELAPRPADEAYEVVLVPQPRVRPTTWRLELDTGDGVLQRTLELARSVVVGLGDDDPRPWRPEDRG